MLEISYGDGVVGSSKFHYRLDDRKKIIKIKIYTNFMTLNYRYFPNNTNIFHCESL